jgi:hypothetical protein
MSSTIPAADSSAGIITLEVDDVQCRGSGACPDFVRTLLTHRGKRLEYRSNRTAVWHDEPTYLFREHPRGWNFPVGLLSQVERAVQARGLRLEIRDRRVRSVPTTPIGAKYHADLTGHQRVVANWFIGHHSGQFEVRNSLDVIETIDLFAALYPAARLLLITVTSPEAETIRERLLKLRPGVEKVTCELMEPVEGISVACTAALPNLNPADYDAFFFIGAGSLRQKSATRLFEINFSRQRRFTFFTPGEGFSPREYDRIATATGSAICSWLPPHGRPVDVVATFADLLSPSGTTPAENRLQRVPSAIWNNAARNRAIAELAQAIIRRDAMVLETHGVPLRLIPEAPWLTILVDSPAHAMQLATLLPDWEVYPPSPAVLRRMIPFAHILPGTLSRGCIMTFVQARSRMNGRFGVFLRADGGKGQLTSVGFPPPQGETPHTSLTLIDVDDHFDRPAALATEDRLRGYESRGFVIERAPQRAIEMAKSSTTRRPSKRARFHK